LVSHIQGYSEVRRIPSVTIRKIGYDDKVLIILEFCVLAGVLYGVILLIVERRKKMGFGGDFALKVVDKEMNFY